MNFSNFTKAPVETILGVIGGFCTYLSTQSVLDSKPSAPQVVSVVLGGVIFVFGAISKTPPPSAS